MISWVVIYVLIAKTYFEYHLLVFILPKGSIYASYVLLLGSIVGALFAYPHTANVLQEEAYMGHQLHLFSHTALILPTCTILRRKENVPYMLPKLNKIDNTLIIHNSCPCAPMVNISMLIICSIYAANMLHLIVSHVYKNPRPIWIQMGNV